MTRRDSNKPAPLQDPAAERAVLGAVLRTPDLFFAVRAVLTHEAFVDPLLSDIYRVIGEAHDAGRRPTLAHIVSSLGEEVNGVEVDSACAVLMKNAAEIEQPLDFADNLATLAARRRLIEIADKAKEAAQSGASHPSSIISKVEASLMEAAFIATPRRPQLLSEVAKTVLHPKAEQTRAATVRFGTGLPSLDEIVGDIVSGDYVVILGAQGDGKTSLAVQIGGHIALAKPVLMVTAEMSKEQIAARELAAASGFTLREIRSGQMRLDETALLDDAQRSLERQRLYLHDVSRIRMREIRALALAMQRTVGLGAIIMDQLDKVETERRYSDRFERLAEVNGDGKALAKDLHVPFFMLAQRTRGSQRRDDPTPHVTDADAPSVDRDADIIIAPYREENWLRVNRPSPKMGSEALDAWAGKIANARQRAKIIVLKHRSMKPHEEREFQWDGEKTRFVEW